MMRSIVYNDVEMLRCDEEKGRYEFFVPITDSFEKLPKGRNPRATDPGSKTYKSMLSTLATAPDKFEDFNRGVQATATAIQYDVTNKRVIVTLNPERKDGNFDGGHSQDAVYEKRAEIPPGVARLRIDFYCADLSDEEIQSIAYAKNDQKAQEPRNHADLNGSFANLKTALGPTVCNNVSFFDGDPGNYRVEYLIDLEIAATAGVAAKFFTQTRLSKFTSVASFYRKGAAKKVEWHGKRQGDLARLCAAPNPLMRDVVHLWDYVTEKSECFYDSEVKKGSYIRLAVHSNPLVHRGRDVRQTFSGTTVENCLPKTMRLMITEGLLRHELKFDRETNSITWRDSLESAKKRYELEAHTVIKFLNRKWAEWSKEGKSARDFSENTEIWEYVAQLLA